MARTAVARVCKEVSIRSAPNKPISPLSEGLRYFRKFAVGLALLAAIGIYAYPKIFQSVNSKLAGAIEKQLNEHLQKIGMAGSVSDAKFVEGKGIQVTGLQLVCDQGNEVFEIENALVHSPAQLPDLLAGNFKPTAVELFDVALHVSRDPDGQWNLERLLPRLSELKPTGAPIPVAIRNSKIRYTDYRTQKPAVYEFKNLQLQIEPTPSQPTRLSVMGSVNLFGNSTCSFSTQPAAEGFSQIEYEFTRFPINRTTLGLLPRGTLPVDLRGVVGLVSGQGSMLLENSTKKTSNIVFNADLQNVAVDHKKMPYIVSECAGPIKIEKGILRGDISGNIGSGENLHGQFYVVGQMLLANPKVWRLDGVCKQLTLDHRLAKPFPKGVKTFFADFDPRGIVDVKFSLSKDKDGFHRSASGDVSGMRFNFVKFPYPVNNAHGTVNLNEEKLTFDITAKEQDQPLHFTGGITGHGQSASALINFWNEGKLPIDKKLATAVAAVEKVAPTLFDFRPSGLFQVAGQARKPAGQDYFDLDYDVQLFDCKSRHAYFEYPFSNINGKVRVRNTNVEIQDIRSVNGASSAVCNGNWNPTLGLHLKFDVHNVPLDQQLADALPPDVRYVWDAIRPDGTAHYVNIDLTTPPDSETNIILDGLLADPQDASSSTAAITPLWFPYRIANMDGRIRIGDGKFRMDRVRGRHENTWMTCNSFGDYNARAWNMQLADLRIGAITVDDDLLKAVPESLREALVGLDYRGKASATGTVNMGGNLMTVETLPAENANPLNTMVTATTSNDQINRVSFEQPIEPLANAGQTDPFFEMNWNVRVDVDQAAMNVGLAIDNVFGYATFAGRYDGENVISDGAIAVDSLHVMDIQVTDVRGPLWIENNRVGIGSMSKPNNDPTIRESLVGNVFGGAARLDGQSWLENGEDRFYVQASVSNANLESATGQMSTQLKEIGGFGNLAMRLTGGETRESIRGEGLFQLRDANIYELPVVLGMLKTLKNRRTNRSAFDAGNVDFTIAGNTATLNRVELLGDAISLIGQGKLDLRGQVNMNFYSVIGRNRMHIPIISDLAKASSQSIMWWKVDGSFSDPQIYTEILPGLNESMSDLFQVEEPAPPRWAQDPFSPSTIGR